MDTKRPQGVPLRQLLPPSTGVQKTRPAVLDEFDDPALVDSLRNAYTACEAATHMSEFRRFHIRLALITCPMAGFALFLLLCERRSLPINS